MKEQKKAPDLTDDRLKGNVMLGKKATLRQYENVTVNLMIEFALNESNHVTEAKKLMDAVDEIIQLTKRRWS